MAAAFPGLQVELSAVCVRTRNTPELLLATDRATAFLRRLEHTEFNNPNFQFCVGVLFALRHGGLPLPPVAKFYDKFAHLQALHGPAAPALLPSCADFKNLMLKSEHIYQVTSAANRDQMCVQVPGVVAALVNVALAIEKREAIAAAPNRITVGDLLFRCGSRHPEETHSFRDAFARDLLSKPHQAINPATGHPLTVAYVSELLTRVQRVQL